MCVTNDMHVHTTHSFTDKQVWLQLKPLRSHDTGPMGTTPSRDETLKRTRTSQVKLTRLQLQARRRIVDLRVEMRNHVRSGEMTEAKRCADSIVKSEQFVNNLSRTISTLDTLAQHEITAESIRAVAGCVRDISDHLDAVGGDLKVPAVAQLITNFQKQAEGLSALGDTLNDGLADTGALPDDANEAERILNAVVDAERLALTNNASDVPLRLPATPLPSRTEQLEHKAE